MASRGRLLQSGNNAAGDSGKQANGLLKTSTWSLKNIRIVFCLILAFIAGFLLTIVVTQRIDVSWKGSLTLNSSSWGFSKPLISITNERLLSFLNSSQSYKETSIENLGKKPDGFEHSEAFKDFVRKKDGKFSSTAQYLASVNTYLKEFRSPMIREEPSQYSWPQTNAEKTLPKNSSASVSTKRLVWYNVPSYFRALSSQERFSICPVKDCVLTYDFKTEHANADAVIFLAAPGKVVPPRDHARQVYIFFEMESPRNVGGGYRITDWNKAFNWTWNFRVDSDIFEPVGYLKRLPSVPTHNTLLSLKRKKMKLVAWMCSHCNAHSKRDQYVKRMQKVIPVDIYGKCGTLKCPRSNKECDTILNDYLFYLSFENSMCLDYVTEKYYKTFFHGLHVVPVVRGGANYSRFFPAGTFIDAEAFSGPEELGRYLLQLAQDEAAYVDMMWRQAHFEYHEHGINDAFCKVCYKMHHLDRFQKTYSDMYAWFHEGKCSDPRVF